MQKIFQAVLDFLFPKEKIELEIENLTIDNLHVTPAQAGVHDIISLFKYKDPFIKKLIEILKYKGNKKVADLCGEILLREIIRLPELVSGSHQIILIPIPQSNKRKREKGFNQCILLCDAIQKASDGSLKYDANILKRKKHTISQTKCNKKKRLQNVVNTMEVEVSEKHKDLLEDKTIILIDDVWTTGATISEAKRVLEKEKIKEVIVFTLAH